MPPKAKINKTMILNAVLNITKERGFEAVNARSIAGELQCSTRPVFTCYRNMEELVRKDCPGEAVSAVSPLLRRICPGRNESV